MSLLLPTARETVGSRGTYLAFASVGVFALVSMYFTVIETRGKTLEDIETVDGADESPPLSHSFIHHVNARRIRRLHARLRRTSSRARAHARDDDVRDDVISRPSRVRTIIRPEHL